MKIAAVCDANLGQKFIDAGSLVDHQDDAGETTLHETLEGLMAAFLKHEE